MSQEDIPNIVVLVGGTVDPVNANPDSRSNSQAKPGAKHTAPPRIRYPTPVFQDIDAKDENWYWMTNKGFKQALQALRDKYNNLHVFTAHGWTGDNSVQARKGAGAYLANRLCGAMGEPAYYENKGKVHFHFIGHSHGGNVINELTRQAAKVWPAQWKIRSITYLSTPFFTQLHQVDSKVFHDDCTIINVTCKYDITQQVIADFSLHPMTGLLKAVGADELGHLLTDMVKDLGPSKDVAQSFFTSINPSILKEGSRWNELHTWKNLTDGLDWEDLKKLPAALKEDLKQLDIRVAFKKEEGIRFYSLVHTALSRLLDFFTKLRAAIHQLNQGITYEVHKSVHPSKKQTRQVLSSALAARFLRHLDLLEPGLVKTRAAFAKRLKEQRFPILCVAEDLYVTEFLKPLNDFLQVNPKTLSGPVLELVIQLLVEQVDVFDNTGTTPAPQLLGKMNSKKHHFPIVHVDVSTKDGYSKQKRDLAFDKFVARLKGIEKRLAGKKLGMANSKMDLVDLLLTLVAQMEPVRATVTHPKYTGYMHAAQAALGGIIAWKLTHAGTLIQAGLTRGKSLDLELQLIRLASIVDTYFSLLKGRSAGQLQPVGTQKPPVQGAANPELGSVPYFAMTAHSTSREDLYPEVKQALEKNLTTRRRR
ncbi:hypothetical protein ATI61_108261 [Archangium gephyra]|uniref:Uncharacterized protein n=1 Tax=Archangium gephyra TaxID=48 RepID=A0AAC8TDZ2_9BACT|nr:hypothetical protein [Archangium gephyra]AKJ02352.1 Hypothetical protein AA314_03978 [Archangium gephyra]REG28720.1 hypothetical protein ATI61_108261 [Archangium gephyra]